MQKEGRIWHEKAMFDMPKVEESRRVLQTEQKQGVSTLGMQEMLQKRFAQILRG